MLAIDGFLRGLWVGILATAIWALVAGFTGWAWMRPWGVWVFLVVGLIAAFIKLVNDSPRERRRREVRNVVDKRISAGAVGRHFGRSGVGCAVRDNRMGLDAAANAVGIPAGDAGGRIGENRPG